MSFGAGIILSALAFVLLPKGMEVLSVWGGTGSFLSGAILFMLLDRKLAESNSQQATLLAMMLRVTFRSPPFIVALAGDGVKGEMSSPA